jgi:hypothetical protein
MLPEDHLGEQVRPALTLNLGRVIQTLLPYLTLLG